MGRLLRSFLIFELGAWVGSITSAALAKRVLPSYGDEESDDVALVAILGGIELESRAKAFRGGSLIAWFGGVEVDLRKATLAPEAKLTIGALFGGVEVTVPRDWRVIHTARGFAGGMSVDIDEPEDPDAPTLTLEISTAFGGVSLESAPSDRAGDH